MRLPPTTYPLTVSKQTRRYPSSDFFLPHRTPEFVYNGILGSLDKFSALQVLVVSFRSYIAKSSIQRCSGLACIKSVK